jgi:hypothetical protein
MENVSRQTLRRGENEKLPRFLTPESHIIAHVKNISWLNVAFKGLLIFLLLTVLIGDIPADALGQVSIYNHLVPGRPRLPFGETPQRSYNLSLYNLEAMFASHEISAQPVNKEEYRVILLGDSSVWGTLLKPEETLAGRLNARSLTICGKPARFYNLGYPTISLTKDVLILQRALKENPDLAVWVTSLEAFPADKQYASPLAANNRALVQPILGGELPSAQDSNFFDSTLVGRRREFADWARLQLYGIPWAATGIDQDYPANYPKADVDLEADETFHNLKPGDDLSTALAWDVLDKGMKLAGDNGLPVVLVNEPIMISNGANSNLRYNFYYPRWAYDQYRQNLSGRAAADGWTTLDAWDAIPMDQFTNSAIHLTPTGEDVLAGFVAHALVKNPCK